MKPYPQSHNAISYGAGGVSFPELSCWATIWVVEPDAWARSRVTEYRVNRSGVVYFQEQLEAAGSAELVAMMRSRDIHLAMIDRTLAPGVSRAMVEAFGGGVLPYSIREGVRSREPWMVSQGCFGESPVWIINGGADWSGAQLSGVDVPEGLVPPLIVALETLFHRGIASSRHCAHRSPSHVGCRGSDTRSPRLWSRIARFLRRMAGRGGQFYRGGHPAVSPQGTPRKTDTRRSRS